MKDGGTERERETQRRKEERGMKEWRKYLIEGERGDKRCTLRTLKKGGNGRYI